jgi:hypothetical protein
MQKKKKDDNKTFFYSSNLLSKAFLFFYSVNTFCRLEAFVLSFPPSKKSLVNCTFCLFLAFGFNLVTVALVFGLELEILVCRSQEHFTKNLKS